MKKYGDFEIYDLDTQLHEIFNHIGQFLSTCFYTFVKLLLSLEHIKVTEESKNKN